MRRAIVVGASSGIGEALVRRLCADGWHVVAVARREAELRAIAASITEGRGGRVDVVVHDVTEAQAAAGAFVQAVDTLGGLDAIVYNAGVLPRVEIDEYDTAKDAWTVEVNVIGAMAWLNEAARHMHAQRAGVIVGVGSVAGDRGRAGQPGYNASKAALHTYLEALRNRLSRDGVRVVTIKPGPVRTAMLGDRQMPLTVEAGAVAEVIASSLTSGPLVRYVHWGWGPIMMVIRHIPSFVFRRLGLD
ncbi:MAG TPA: SDR family NAD(P)-dependent oxidoreductase [Myxococcota bacterium]|nr:SDR family NAD(P)-dependent oxidoreductase [Myxococcota bacterium]